jgi:hypothetical protein
MTARRHHIDLPPSAPPANINTTNIEEGEDREGEEEEVALPPHDDDQEEVATATVVPPVTAVVDPAAAVVDPEWMSTVATSAEPLGADQWSPPPRLSPLPLLAMR